MPLLRFHRVFSISATTDLILLECQKAQQIVKVRSADTVVCNRDVERVKISVTAELLAGARALSLADRHHFDLNLSDLLDKSTQHKRDWLLNVIAARQRFERQQADFEGIQTLSIANSKLIKWMTAGRASWSPLNLVLPDAPSLGHNPVPSLPGPTTLCLQLKMPFAITLNGPTLRWRFQQPRHAQGSATLTQTFNESVKTAPTKTDQPQQNVAQWSPHDVDCSPVAPVALFFALIPLTN